MREMLDAESELADLAWQALTGDDHEATPRPSIEVAGDAVELPSRFRVADVAVAAVATALGAAIPFHHGQQPLLDRGHVSVAVRSERHFQAPGVSGGGGFAPLSRFWQSADGWVRTHANYPWHRAALLRALDVPDDEREVAAGIRTRRAEDVEADVFAADGIAAAVRFQEVWREHPQGRAVESEPLIGLETIGAAAPRTRIRDGTGLAGLRVLDLTRVIAGPVATRFLGALGADVLRIDPPRRRDMRPGRPADTLLGKRSAFLDLASSSGVETLHRLAASADVIVCGYRPRSLDRFGLEPQRLAERNPGLVVIYLSAWGHSGPWANRRGFDSVVQAPTGIAWAESQDGMTPGALPCALLDHSTGYLAAAAALDGLRRQRVDGGTYVRRVSLARTAAWVASTRTHSPQDHDTDVAPWLVEVTAEGDEPVTAVAPPGSFGAVPLRWRPPATSYGADRAEW